MSIQVYQAGVAVHEHPAGQGAEVRLGILEYLRQALPCTPSLCFLCSGAGYAAGLVGHPVLAGETLAHTGTGHILTIESPESAQVLHQKSRRVRSSDPSIPHCRNG